MSLEGIRAPVVRVVDAGKRFGGGERATTALHGVRFEAVPGEVVLLVGPSGSGKTTLLNLIAGLTRPTSGSVSLFGLPLGGLEEGDVQRLRCERIGLVFQTYMLVDALTVAENVAIMARFAGRSKPDAQRRAEALLQEFGIAHIAARRPPTLDPGEKQRVALARAFANEPGLVLADEPTAGLDSAEAARVLEALHRYAKQRNACVIVATHDPRLISNADRCLRLSNGTLSEETCVQPAPL